MPGPIYGRVDCLTNTGNADRGASEMWVSFWNFMETLQSASYVELVAFHSGANATSGSTGYWDDPDPFGQCAFGVWKWVANENRPWEWFMFAELITGSADLDVQSFASPGLSLGSSNFLGSTSTRGIAVATAVCWSGSQSYNPWNGTTGLGNASKGTPVWVSGSNDRTLCVFPRSNNANGTHNTNKENTLSMGDSVTMTATSARWHILADKDGLLWVNDREDNSSTTFIYNGAFKVRDSLSGSAIGQSAYGMLQFGTFGAPPSDTISNTSTVGDTAGSTHTVNGGMAVGIPDFTVIGFRTYFNSANQTTHQPCTFNNNSIDEYTLTVAAYENPHFGVAGTIDTPLLRYSWRAVNWDISSDNSRVWFGGDNLTTTGKITTAWSGSTPPGTGTSRTGSLIYIANPS